MVHVIRNAMMFNCHSVHVGVVDIQQLHSYTYVYAYNDSLQNV